MDIDIELLNLTVDGAAGHEHRFRAIAARAAEILASQLAARSEAEQGPRRIQHLKARAVHLDLNRMSDEYAAHKVADAWIVAMETKLEMGV